MNAIHKYISVISFLPSIHRIAIQTSHPQMYKNQQKNL
jgi:hypothetical protein